MLRGGTALASARVGVHSVASSFQKKGVGVYCFRDLVSGQGLWENSRANSWSKGWKRVCCSGLPILGLSCSRN